jgi:hypothetical protein
MNTRDLIILNEWSNTMKFSKWSWIAALMLVLSAALGLGLIAAEDAPEPNTPEDNACYEGGVMAGKCDSDWAWKGGWYLARFLSDDLTREQVPDEFQILLPPPVETPVAVNVLTLCKGYGYKDMGRICLSSNQTGSLSYRGDEINLYYVFTATSGANCPTTFNGYMLNADPGNNPVLGSTSQFTFGYGYSDAEMATLGLHSQYCSYYPKSG